MRVRVMKFGGTSVATADARCKAVAKVGLAKESGVCPVVVVSAIGRRGMPYATDTLIDTVREIDPQTPPDSRELDMIMACGEIMSAVVFAHTLKAAGHRAMAITGWQAGIETDTSFGCARINCIDPQNLLRLIDQGVIPVVCGFQGTFSDPEGLSGEVTTLGRGGSDTTASALGAALRAEAVEIYTDVDGVKSANPSFVKNAKTLAQVSYGEVAEFAHLGAKVLHPRAAEIAMDHGIPLWVKNTFSDERGTEVVKDVGEKPTGVTGVTNTGRLVHMNFDLNPAEPEHRAVIASKIYRLMGEEDMTLFNTNMGGNITGFAVPREQFPTVHNVLDAMVLPMDGKFYILKLGQPSREFRTQVSLLDNATVLPVQLIENCTLVSVIGREYLQRSGVFLAVLETLHEAEIPVHQTADSEYSVGCLINESDTEEAVRLLHDRFAVF